MVKWNLTSVIGDLRFKIDMKRIFVILAAVMTLCSMQAQVVAQNEAAMVYYSPKTAIVLDFTFTIETRERGLYADYAEAMIGAKDVVEQTQTICKLKETCIRTVTETDYNRPHKVVYDANVPMLLSINEKGLLLGYNLPPAEKADKPHEQHNTAERNKRTPVTAVSPFTEDVLQAASPLAQAHAVAKQIFHLRETRMYLLNGEVENAPADGKAMELVLNELDKQEKQLTELFIGKKSVRKEHKIVRFWPSDKGKQLYFSEENGFTDAENLDADTIEVKMVCQQQCLSAPDMTKKKKGDELSQIVYNLPGHADVKVLYKGKTLAKRSVPVAQLGADIALPKSMFTGKDLPVIVVSPKTGNIESISR